MADLDRKVRRGKDRLEQEVQPAPPPPISAEKAEQLSLLEEKIKNLLEQVESLGESGKVDEAEALMRKVEILNIEKTALTKQPQSAITMLTQEKKMSLCEICGAFLVANDAEERVQAHITGKQHVGYGMIRDFLSEYKAAKEKATEEERLAREKEVEEKTKQREKESRGRRSESSDRDRYRDGDREHSRHRERSRERDGRGNDKGRGMDRRRHGDYRNGKDGGRSRYYDRDSRQERVRSRSRSPARHGNRR